MWQEIKARERRDELSGSGGTETEENVMDALITEASKEGIYTTDKTLMERRGKRLRAEEALLEDDAVDPESSDYEDIVTEDSTDGTGMDDGRAPNE